MDHLIIKYLQNDLTLQEQHQLTKWLEEDEENIEHLQKIESYWKDYGIDLEETEKKVRKKLFSRIEKSIESTPKSRYLYSVSQILRLVALVVVCFSLAFSVYILSHDSPTKTGESVILKLEKISKRGEKLTVKLPDGSTVKLNSGSRIIYPETFTSDTREVVLHGEGFFNVTKDPHKPFIIDVNRARIRVLGTSFNVNSIRSSNQVIVGVKSGQVKVSNHQENVSRILNPSELVIFNNEDEQMELMKIQDDELIFGWTKQLLVFKDNNLDKILNTLSNWYGVEFILLKNIDTQRVFTSKYDNPTLKSVLESLSYVYDFEYEINENTIIIK